MTSSGQPMTIRSLLFEGDGDGYAPVDTMARAIADDGAAHAALRARRNLSPLALETVDQEVAFMADGLLDLDVGDLLIGACRTYSRLIESADRTLTNPGSEEVVSLAAHRVTSRYSPRIDLLVDQHPVHTFELELRAVLEVSGLEAVVSAGGLVALRSGAGQAAATLTLDGADLASRKRPFDPVVIVRLNPPVPLVVRDDASPSGAHQ